MKKTLGVLCALGLLAAFPAQAAPITYYAALSGAAEAPPNASPGTGEAWVTFDDVAHTLRVKVTFSGLLGNVTASHIHCCTRVPFAGTAGVATATPTFPGVPVRRDDRGLRPDVRHDDGQHLPGWVHHEPLYGNGDGRRAPRRSLGVASRRARPT